MIGIEVNGAETRRGFLRGGLAAVAGLSVGPALHAAGPLMPTLARLPMPPAPAIAGVSPRLLAAAKAALAGHGRRIVHRDLIAIADFNRVSADPRFHLVDLMQGRVTSFLVAHGRGSDPAHKGWVEYFSNEPGSLATSRGAYVTGQRYTGKYGLSLRLDGLDTSNSYALERAIVVHGAPYVGEQMIRDYGKLGRSEGCFAVAPDDLYKVLARLAPGHLIYADKA